jgi:hypothetical protein
MPTTISQPEHQTAITGIVSTEDAHVRRLFVGASTPTIPPDNVGHSTDPVRAAGHLLALDRTHHQRRYALRNGHHIGAQRVQLA